MECVDRNRIGGEGRSEGDVDDGGFENPLTTCLGPRVNELAFINLFQSLFRYNFKI